MPPSANLISAPSASNVISAAASIVKLFAEIVKSVPSPSIFSESPPNMIPTLFGICTSDVAVKLILAPEVTVKSVLSPSIFSPLPNVIPTFAGITTSATAVKLIYFLQSLNQFHLLQFFLHHYQKLVQYQIQCLYLHLNQQQM